MYTGGGGASMYGQKKKQWHLIKKRKVISLNWVAAVGPLGKQCLCLQVICFTKRKR